MTTRGSRTRAGDRPATVAAAATAGAGLMAALDQVVFHELLGWHHLVDAPTVRLALVSDAVLHVAQLVALAVGAVLLVRLARAGRLVPQVVRPALLVGAGLFQVFDGLVLHKVLDLHEVRAGAEPVWPYDLAWNGAGVVLLAVGILLLRRS